METVTRLCGHRQCPPHWSCQVREQVLPAIPSTLLIPLAARAAGGTRFPWLGCDDHHAADLLQCLDVDPALFLADAPTVVNVLWRTRLLKAAGQDFFARHPRATGVNLGCGLSSHFQWLDSGRNHWIDADLPEVIALRTTLLPDGTHRHNAVVDLRQPGWWRALGLPGREQSTPVFLVCEGALMYLEPAQARAVLREFAEQAPPGSQLVLDTLSYLAVGHARLHASVGPTGAEFRWGVHWAGELTDPHPRLELQALRSAAECYGPGGLWAESCWQPWLGTPLYGLATLGLRD